MSDNPVKGYNKEGLGNTFIVALVLCLVCAFFVSASRVVLTTAQDANKLKDRKKNILAAAGLLEPDTDINAKFDELIIDRIIDLESGNDVTAEYESPATYDQISVAEASVDGKYVDLDDDPAQLKRREKHAHVFVVRNAPGSDEPKLYVFPIRGRGLYSVLKGFVALDADLTTIRGLTYYDHGETPGLGGEVDNPDWKSHWVGKLMFNEQRQAVVDLVKADWETNPHAVDALSGASITSRGVKNMLRFWMSEQGFGNYIEKVRGQQPVTGQAG
jgi:Na+-transporting NADH:ubiquinone oxidoreductase subunit C